MINFKQLNDLIKYQFDIMCQTGKLFRSSMTGQEVWDSYIIGFKPEQNPIFRDPNSSEHNCNNDNNFIRRYGNIVAIDKDYNIITMFDIDIEGSVYEDTIPRLSSRLKNSTIQNVFFESFRELNILPYEKCSLNNELFQLGMEKTFKRYTKEEVAKFGVVNEQDIYRFDHFHVFLPTLFVDKSNKSVEAIMGEYRDAKNVFQRLMEEVSLDTLELVQDLINQGSLLNGIAYINKLKKIIPLKKYYDKLPLEKRDNWCWIHSYNNNLAKFKNEVIGVLCTQLAEGKEINEACQSFNKMVDPVNYMKAVTPITKRQIEEAKKFVEQNGYEESFNRRFATIDDIKVSEILHFNAGDGKVKNLSIFDNVKTTSSRHKRSEFDKVEEVSIEKFMSDILPNCTNVEVLLTNQHQGNMVSITTSNIPDSKPIFKWNNNYSWTYNGNLAGKSQLAEMVEAKGGRTDGVFRFTHSWNEIEPNQSLMDLHVFMPGNNHYPERKIHDDYGIRRRIGWNNRTDSQSGGIQDVDYVTEAPIGYVPVENITFPSLSKMPEGKYICKIHNWNFRKTGGKGKAEIAFNGELHQYIYPATKGKEWVTIAEVTLKDGIFTIKHILEPINSNETVKEIYGLDTNQFHKVNLVCLSPNYWDNNNIGNKHYFFMLDNCRTNEPIRGFHNENLIPELLQHRKVLDVLGNSCMIEPSKKQLSGLGFNATVKDELIVRLSGSHKRVIKIKFT